MIANIIIVNGVSYVYGLDWYVFDDSLSRDELSDISGDSADGAWWYESGFRYVFAVAKTQLDKKTKHLPLMAELAFRVDEVPCTLILDYGDDLYGFVVLDENRQILPGSDRVCKGAHALQREIDLFPSILGQSINLTTEDIREWLAKPRNQSIKTRMRYVRISSSAGLFNPWVIYGAPAMILAMIAFAGWLIFGKSNPDLEIAHVEPFVPPSSQAVESPPAPVMLSPDAVEWMKACSTIQSMPIMQGPSMIKNIKCSSVRSVDRPGIDMDVTYSSMIKLVDVKPIQKTGWSCNVSMSIVSCTKHMDLSPLITTGSSAGDNVIMLAQNFVEKTQGLVTLILSQDPDSFSIQSPLPTWLYPGIVDFITHRNLEVSTLSAEMNESAHMTWVLTMRKPKPDPLQSTYPQ